MPGVIVAMADLCLVSAKRDPAYTLVCLKFDNAGLNWAIEDLETIKRALASFVRCLVRNIFDDDKPVGPVDGH